MNSFFLLFIGIPALEIFLIIKIGGQIGALSTVSLIFLTAVIGVYFAKLEGIRTIRSGAINLYQNKINACLFLDIQYFLLFFLNHLFSKKYYYNYQTDKYINAS